MTFYSNIIFKGGKELKTDIAYWTIITLIGIVHFQAVLLTLSLEFQLQFYFTCLLVIAMVYYFFKKTPFGVSILGLKWNTSLFLMQLLLVLIYVTVEPSWVYFIPIFIFIGIEGIRLFWSKQIMSLSKNLKYFEEQSIHFNEMFRLVRSERHDFLKHVSAIHFLLENGKSKEAKTYLDDLVDGYEETNLSIKGERGIVAGVLHQMYRKGKASGISVVYDFDLPLSTLPFSDQHMVTLLGNLLSNSIDACEEWQEKQKKQPFITLQFYKRSGLYLLICKNNSLPISTSILDGLFQIYGKTTKKGEHEGLGTKLIHDIVKVNKGFLDFVYKDQEFTVKIKIPAIR